MFKYRPTLCLSLLAASAWTAFAFAQEPVRVCISCTNPQQSYACHVIPPDNGVMAQSPNLHCASHLAQEYGHRSCIIVRSAAENCEGKKVTVAYTGPVAESSEWTAADEKTENPEAAPESKEPKTLIEATDQAVKSTGKAVGNAGETVTNLTKKTGDAIQETGQAVGDTVSGAAKSTWKCLSSLFQSC